jgi:hypothetical protein
MGEKGFMNVRKALFCQSMYKLVLGSPSNFERIINFNSLNISESKDFQFLEK